MEMRQWEVGPSQGWGSEKRKKDSRIFVGLLFVDTIYLEQI